MRLFLRYKSNIHTQNTCTCCRSISLQFIVSFWGVGWGHFILLNFDMKVKTQVWVRTQEVYVHVYAWGNLAVIKNYLTFYNDMEVPLPAYAVLLNECSGVPFSVWVGRYIKCHNYIYVDNFAQSLLMRFYKFGSPIRPKILGICSQ